MTHSNPIFDSFVSYGVLPSEALLATTVTDLDLAGVVVISGKMGSGKDTIAPILMPALGRINVTHRFFAAPLKEEINEIIEIIKDSDTQNLAQGLVVLKMGVDPGAHVSSVIDTLWGPVKSGEVTTSYDRTTESRTALQYWGTQVRRAQDENYWVNRAVCSLTPELARETSVYVTDARFPNELDAVKEIGGILVRLDVSPEEQARRIFERDGIVISEAARAHISETAVDDYQHFDVRLDTDGLTPNEVVAEIMHQLATKEQAA